ncbi:hypothetical protein MCOR07_002444 [Pyricularia oryzae]|nr:hypothetical protein MCOR01_002145 [Pyricularia oryzae]KAI6355792.1 hypothetical protein MCOR32_010144 [Pyricularia oryzae]KAI6391258.1 hypothetical protein MCOR23_009056 [Pyricularia oryzae]KAI6446412.1 hypothetical protein MCOR15_010483 [Pyricularia oryzae]KAI6454449.1 hypothetical protein MCOR22_000060 [Pyricularia oryzae]
MADQIKAGDVTMFTPPIVRSAAATLNKALFTKKFNLAAASVREATKIASYRKALEKSGDALHVERVSVVQNDPGQNPATKGRKCILLRPGIEAAVPETWGNVVSEGVKTDDLTVIPYELTLDYDHWTAHEVLSSFLPIEFADDIQSSFNFAGHVAHLNLRDQFLPYKQVIGEVLCDKNPAVRTVINKTRNVGDTSEFRTFPYEVLAGPDDLNIVVRENNCTFKLDYAKVYWNSKLEPEHTRMVKDFQPGEVVADAMAGIGPFAVPAGKKGVFVWANDKNPESYKYLQEAITINKVGSFVRPFNQDAIEFIRGAADSVLAAHAAGEGVTLPAPKVKRADRDAEKAAESQEQTAPRPRVMVPPTISHYVMNLPASAISFLPAYRGLYHGHEKLFTPHTTTRLPLIHAYCFDIKSDTDEPKHSVVQRVAAELGVEMKLGDRDGDNEIEVLYVREVAPNKTMYRATFRLPKDIAFAERD